MKKTLIFLFTVLSLAACDVDEHLSGGGAGSTLHECVLPLSVTAGDEVAVQWNGFKDSARLYMVAEDKSEREMEIQVITSSGIIFRVPGDMAPGMYSLVLDQDSRQELGNIEVLEADIPVRNITMPVSGIQGESVVIKGIGFEDDAEITFEDASGSSYEMEINLQYDGISVFLSPDLPAGQYKVFLSQNGGKWLICSSFNVSEKAVIKSLESIEIYHPYIGSDELKYVWDISKEEMTLSEFVVSSSGEQQLNVRDTYAAVGEYSYELVEDGREQSNEVSFTYALDEDGRVMVADVLRFGKSETLPYTWTYDSDGFLVDISTVRTLYSLEYDEGNLTSFNNISFEYEDASMVNNPHAPDVAWAYVCMNNLNDPSVYFPYLLGIYRNASALLPTAIQLPDPTGTGAVTCQLSYVFDEDGYVTAVSSASGNTTFRLILNYSTGVTVKSGS